LIEFRRGAFRATEKISSGRADIISAYRFSIAPMSLTRPFEQILLSPDRLGLPLRAAKALDSQAGFHHG